MAAMSRRTSRQNQQAMNEWRRTGRWAQLWMAGIPYSPKPGVWMVPSDPQKERQEFVRQLTERRPLDPGEPEPMRGEFGTWNGIRIITNSPPVANSHDGSTIPPSS